MGLSFLSFHKFCTHYSVAIPFTMAIKRNEVSINCPQKFLALCNSSTLLSMWIYTFYRSSEVIIPQLLHFIFHDRGLDL